VPPAILLACLSALLAGCFNVRAPDLFLLTRSGGAGNLTLLVNDGGTIRCNGGPAKPLSDKLLIQARYLATQLDNDAKKGFRFPRSPQSVTEYSVKLQQGTVSFPDTAGRQRPELAQTELFVVQAAEGACGLNG
jgi:hypothetical protein